MTPRSRACGPRCRAKTAHQLGQEQARGNRGISRPASAGRDFAPDRVFVYLPVQGVQDGSATTWLEAVAEADYLSG